MEYILKEEIGFVCILCDTFLYILKESGTIHWQKRLDQPVLSMHCYWIDEPTQTVFERMVDNKLMILLTTEHNSILLYGEKKLKWACATPFAVLSASNIRLADGALRACLLLFGDQGELSVGCLGTSPSLELVTSLKKKNFKSKTKSISDDQGHDESMPASKQEFDEEMQQLQKAISNVDSEFDQMFKLNSTSTKDNEASESQTMREDRSLSIELGKPIMKVLNGQIWMEDDQESTVTVQHWLARQDQPELTNMFEFTISLSTRDRPVGEVRCFVSCLDEFQCIPNNLYFKSIDPNSTSELFYFQVQFKSNQVSLRNSDSICVLLTYIDYKQNTHILNYELPIPSVVYCASSNNQNYFNKDQNDNEFKFSFTSKSTDFDLKQIAKVLLLSHKQLDKTSNDWNVSSQSNSSNQWTDQVVLKCSVLPQEEDEEVEEEHEAYKEKSKQPCTREDLVCLKLKRDFNVNTSANNQANGLYQYSITLNGSSLQSCVFVLNYLLEYFQALILQKSIVRLDFSNHFVPMQAYFDRIDQHLALRQQIQTEKQQLEDHCVHYRIINKRLLIKLKERNLTNLNNLDLLLEMFYNKVCFLIFVCLQLFDKIIINNY